VGLIGIAGASLILAAGGTSPFWANAWPPPPKIRETRTRVEIMIFRNFRVDIVVLLL
jgi:hypothetical protein